ncbi:phosphohistidine phosphatase SixA [Colwellia sp. E2M01]|uniref:phosphohistidine phosphatase SixA n=1 Tax=Colwellia sp. E2M01 TaxID=2841561 RepID=UPI001C093E72|nr:phosphohistidine phosphatase SixA [Colwellia sp. E2M01]MBU2871254.1 phosphohistidine phosphatase SixA [Colwellia sp. E2M01]
MQLYIMRHGEAKQFNPQINCQDSELALTEHGKQEAKIMADWFAKMKIKPKQVFVSPYLRAQQTCDLVTADMQTAITTLDFITPLDEAQPIHDFIDGWLTEYISKADKNVTIAEDSLLIISHMPLVSFLVAELTQSNDAPIFATAGVAHIDYDIDKMQGTLQGLVLP